MLDKSHWYISWIAEELFKSNPRWSRSSESWPYWEKSLASVGQGLGETLPLLSGSALKMNSSFSRDQGLLCAEAQLLLWGIKPDYTGFAPERLELGSGLITQTKLLAMAPVYPCHFLCFVEASRLGDSSPYYPAIVSGRAECLQEGSVNPADLFRWLEREPNAGVSLKLIQSRCKSSGKSLRIRHVWKLLGW